MINIRIDNIGYNSKPDKKEFAYISNRLSETDACEISFNDFFKLVGEKGHTFCVSDFNEKRKKENFKSQQIFALDFDNTASYSEISKRAESYGLPIALAYETFSSENGNRFRIVFINDLEVDDIRVSEIIMDALMNIFPECDKACSDVSRIFLGGKKIIYSCECYLSISNLLMEFQLFLKDKYTEKHYKKHVEKFAAGHNLDRCSCFIYINEKQSDDCFKFNENNTTYFLNFSQTKESSNRKSNRKQIRCFNFNLLKEKCKLYNDFITDSEWLTHEELFGIACNLSNIEGGKRTFLNVIETSEFDSYRDKDWRYYLNYLKSQEYKPMECDSFCPYCEECNHATNMVLTGKTERNKIVKLKEKEYCTLDEAVSELKETLETAINSDANQINMIKAQTAIGKTHCYVNLIKNSDKKFIIAVPTNILKDEVYKRLIEEGISGAVKTESITTLEQMDNEIGDRVRELNSLGAYNDLVIYLKSEAENNKSYLLNYIKPLDKYAADDVRVIVTTHKKFLNAKDEFLKDYEIIIDEDILLSAIKNSTTVSMDDLRKLKKHKKVRNFFDKLKCDKSQYFVTDTYDTYICYDEMQKKGISSNVNAFFKATAVQVNDRYINCFIPPQFHNIKYTILSATASESVYTMYFRDRIINCIKCREARYKGRLIQDCSRSFSRKDIDNDDELLDNIIKGNPNAKYVITFMKYKKQAGDCQIHYGNTEGCDYMKGENIVVVGTPYYNEVVYKLLAAHLGIDVDTKMKFLEVEDSCYKYWLHTYKSPDLRQIQLWLMKSELIQAVGRARLLRYDCTVKLYASIPLEQAEICE